MSWFNKIWAHWTCTILEDYEIRSSNQKRIKKKKKKRYSLMDFFKKEN